jgi:hypothetical protein
VQVAYRPRRACLAGGRVRADVVAKPDGKDAGGRDQYEHGTAQRAPEVVALR